jgi:hypothetical protein
MSRPQTFNAVESKCAYDSEKVDPEGESYDAELRFLKEELCQDKLYGI